MRKKTRRQRKRLLKTFGKGTGLRKALKRALKDKKFNRRDAKKLTIKGANLKQLEKIRRKSNRLSRFKVDNKINTSGRLKSTFRNTNDKRFSDDTPIRDVRFGDAPNTSGEYVRAPEKETSPGTGTGTGAGSGAGAGSGSGTPTAAEVNDELKIAALDTDSTPESNLETLASNSNVQRYAGNMSGTLAEQAAAADMTIEQFKEKMNDPAYRMRVKGIRFADRGTGGMTRSQLARRGTTGVFGRSGLRIQSLNI